MSRNVLVAMVGILVFLVIAGALYLQILISANQKDLVWAVSRSVSAGDRLTTENVRQMRIPHSGDTWDFYVGDLPDQARAAHDMNAGTIVFKSDIEQREMALVTLSLRTPPPLQHGQTVDVYAQVGNQTWTLGRRLTVDQVSGNACSVWVPAVDEPAWISVQASNVALFAARSTGVGVPQVRQQGIQEALSTLSGGSATGPIGGLPSSSPTAAPTPTPTPKKP